MSEDPIRSRIFYLDGWRGLAIFCVIVGHFYPIPDINVGRLGVLLFFVLSGRLMGQILFVDNFPIKDFFLRRFSRIYPALFVYSSLMLLVSGIVLAFKGGVPLVDAANYFGSILFFSNYLHVYGHNTSAFGHIWSLCIEEHSYVFLAILALMLRVRQLRWAPYLICFVGLLCVFNGLVLNVLMGRDYYAVYHRTDVGAAAIMLSVAMRIWVNARAGLQVNAIVPTAAFVFGVLLNFDLFPDAIKYSLGTLLIAFSVNFIDMASWRVRRVLESKWLVYLGTLSYSVYLWQQPLYRIKSSHNPLFLAVLALILGLISFYVIEKPARRYINRRWASN